MSMFAIGQVEYECGCVTAPREGVRRVVNACAAHIETLGEPSGDFQDSDQMEPERATQ